MALKRLPTRVQQQVLGQVDLAVECLGTMFAGVDFLSAGMLLASGAVSTSMVLLPRVPVIELLGTQVAGVVSCIRHALIITPLLAGGRSHFFTACSFGMAGLNVLFKAGFA